MTVRDCEILMSAVMDLGKTMLVSGAEIYRVEDTITRLIRAYDGSASEVVAVPSHIISSATFDGREYTLVRRIEQTETDLESSTASMIFPGEFAEKSRTHRLYQRCSRKPETKKATPKHSAR